MKMNKWSINDMPDQNGKVAIVTGGNSGLGLQSVKALANKGAEVILATRSLERGELAIKEIGPTEGSIRLMQLDLQEFESINTFVMDFKANYKRVDILINNAGIMTTPFFLTKDGLEGQIGVNHFGHFMLTSKLFDLIKSTPGARIVNVSSNAHKWGKMDFSNLFFEGGKDYTPMKSYGRSKLANLLFTYELQRRVSASGLDIQVLAAHPGGSMTNLARHLEDKWWFKLLLPLAEMTMQDAASGALPQLRAATDPSAEGADYYGPGGFNEIKGAPIKVSSNSRSHDLEDASKLWEVSEQTTKTNFEL
jgi:NAD(P)-dependent dehydrogenase (short-subunit alcohol dehydrogenase family)